MSSSNQNLRWGILSTARIARRNWPAMLESGAATLVAVASRDIGKARSFIDEMQAIDAWPVKPVAIGSYGELLESPDIDAVYIPLPTAVRKEWVLRAAAAGKHVLCEKPCAVTAADLLEMTDACRDNGVLFMDGVVFMHDPRFARLRVLLDEGSTVGQVRRITSAFSFKGDEQFAATDIRGTSGLEPTGCLGDLGWYCLRASLWAMDWEMPVRVSGRILDSATGPDGTAAIMGFSGELDFTSGATAAFFCSFQLPDQRWLSVSGTGGSIRVLDFVNPVAENEAAWEINYQREPKPADPGITNPARLFTSFAAAARSATPDLRWAGYSLKTQLVQDACELSARLGRPVNLDEVPRS